MLFPIQLTSEKLYKKIIYLLQVKKLSQSFESEVHLLFGQIVQVCRDIQKSLILMLEHTSAAAVVRLQDRDSNRFDAGADALDLQLKEIQRMFSSRNS